MAKIVRYTGNLAAFASGAAATERTVFGDTTESDVIDDNVNADFLTGWEIVTANDAPALQDFNAVGFTLSQVISYLHQMGVAEWDSAQEYYEGSVITSAGIAYISLSATNVNQAPTTQPTKWLPISDKHEVVSTTDATVTAISTIAVPENSCLGIEATVNGIKDDFSESMTAFVRYSVRRVLAGAVEVAAASIVVQDDAVGSPVATCDVDGNNARILVTGVAATNYTWSVSYKYNLIV